VYFDNFFTSFSLLSKLLDRKLFIAKNNLEIINQEGNPPTFQPPKGSSFIDITLTTWNAAADVDEWLVDEDFVTSNHNAIRFTITDNTPNNQSTNNTPE
jgi:hypothetical protein